MPGVMVLYSRHYVFGKYFFVINFELHIKSEGLHNSSAIWSASLISFFFFICVWFLSFSIVLSNGNGGNCLMISL